MKKSQFKSLIRNIIKEAKKTNNNQNEVMIGYVKNDHTFDNGREPVMKAVNVGESLDWKDDLSKQSGEVDKNIAKMEKDPSYRPSPFNSPAQVNSLEIYKREGFKCGRARNKKDQGLVSSIQNWFNYAIKLEKGEYAIKAREEFNKGYKEGSGFGQPPKYFREEEKLQQEMTSTGNVAGYEGPAWGTRNKNGSPRAIAAAQKYGKIVKSISEKKK